MSQCCRCCLRVSVYTFFSLYYSPGYFSYFPHPVLIRARKQLLQQRIRAVVGGRLMGLGDDPLWDDIYETLLSLAKAQGAPRLARADRRSRCQRARAACQGAEGAAVLEEAFEMGDHQ